MPQLCCNIGGLRPTHVCTQNKAKIHKKNMEKLLMKAKLPRGYCNRRKSVQIHRHRRVGLRAAPEHQPPSTTVNWLLVAEQPIVEAATNVQYHSNEKPFQPNHNQRSESHSQQSHWGSATDSFHRFVFNGKSSYKKNRQNDKTKALHRETLFTVKNSCIDCIQCPFVHRIYKLLETHFPHLIIKLDFFFFLPVFF